MSAPNYGPHPSDHLHTCLICHRSAGLRYTTSDLMRWKRGEATIVDALPYLMPSDRDLIALGICHHCSTTILTFKPSPALALALCERLTNFNEPEPES